MRLVTSAAILSLLATTALAGPTVTEIKAPTCRSAKSPIPAARR